MKMYQIYLDGDKGWIAKKPEEIADEIEESYKEATWSNNTPDEELNEKVQAVIDKIVALSVGESVTVTIGDNEWKYECIEMTEAELAKLGEFEGW